MNLELLAADIAARVPEMAKDSAINNAELIKKLIRDANTRYYYEYVPAERTEDRP